MMARTSITLDEARELARATDGLLAVRPWDQRARRAKALADILLTDLEESEE